MRWLPIAALLAGCSFQGTSLAITGDAPPSQGEAGSVDAHADGHGGGTDATIDGPMALLPCGAPDTTGLVLCLEFDDSSATIAADGSGRGHDASVANVTVTSRDTPSTSRALQILSTTAIQVPDTTDLDLQTYTMMMWVHRENTPGAGGSYGLIDTGGQYSMTIDDTGHLNCTVTATTGGSSFGLGDLVVLNEWDLVACTRDSAAQQLVMYVFRGASGNPTPDTFAATHTIATASLGTSIGASLTGTGAHTSQLAGKLDSVRIFSRVLTANEICVGAGRSGC